MGRADNWDAIDTGYYFRLIQRINDAGYSVNYQGSIVSRLKSVMSEGFKLKYHGNSDFHQFTRRSEQPDTIYLTKNELEKLWNLDLNDRMERRVRDLFLLGCYTAMRFSDYSRLSFDNIRDGFIHMTQKKTSSSVVLPASPRVMAILKRNGGAAPKIQQAVFNREIKVVCCKAGMNEAIEVTKSKGAGHISEFKPKYTQVSSHTARRTGCTLMYQSGVPASQVMLISGHKSESAFYRYIRTGKEENAKALADNPFFK
jgi:integrase